MKYHQIMTASTAKNWLLMCWCSDNCCRYKTFFTEPQSPVFRAIDWSLDIMNWVRCRKQTRKVIVCLKLLNLRNVGQFRQSLQNWLQPGLRSNLSKDADIRLKWQAFSGPKSPPILDWMARLFEVKMWMACDSEVPDIEMRERMRDTGPI